MLIILFFYLAICSSTTSLGDNLIINSRFLQPDIISQLLNFTFVPKNIPGWSCSHYCQLDNCLPLIEIFIKSKSLFGNCKGQVLDLASDQLEVVTQIFETIQGNHILQVQFFLPSKLANKKILLIYFNQKLVYSYQPLINTDTQSYFISINTQTRRGSNNLTFTSGGFIDPYGYRLTSVSLRRKINMQVQSLISNTFSNQAIMGLISFPGSRIIIGDLINSFVSLDRMQLYYYHNRNYSYYTNMFLKNISTLMSTKGSISLNLQQKILGKFTTKQESFLSQMDYKYKYINKEVLNKSENGYGFVSNNINLFIYSIPFYFVLIVFLYIAFRATFNLKISKLVRKYSFFGIIFLLMICEGNIEQYSFYAFGELNHLFSVNYKHKLLNFVIIALFFIVLISATALNFIAWSHYNKKTRYFVENVDLSLGGITTYSISNGFVCILFGAIHQLLLKYPNIQLLALGITELLWIGAQMICLALNLYKTNWLVWRNIIEGLLRIVFQFTLFLFSQSSNKVNSYINQQIHLKQIITFIIFWMLQFIGSILVFAYEGIKMTNHNKQKRKRVDMTKKFTKQRMIAFQA